jgi:AcrR family transcriptional regulator
MVGADYLHGACKILHDCVHVKCFFVPRPYSMETRSRTTAATRTRLLDATVEVLASVGVEAMTMPAVAAQADVALRTVYNHFPSKTALIVEAYERFAQSTIDAVAGIPTTGSPRERLRWFVAAFYAALDHPGAAVILSVSRVPELDARVAEVRAWRRRELTTILRAAQRDGVLALPLKDATVYAFLLTSYASWHSLAVESELGPERALELALEAIDRTLFTTG